MKNKLNINIVKTIVSYTYKKVDDNTMIVRYIGEDEHVKEAPLANVDG